jgi:hypothetical protein
MWQKRIYNFYLQQIFYTHFVHADPHPGNIFIKPLPTKTERELDITEIRPGDLVEYQSELPFQVVFVDFGMVTEIPLFWIFYLRRAAKYTCGYYFFFSKRYVAILNNLDITGLAFGPAIPTWRFCKYMVTFRFLIILLYSSLSFAWCMHPANIL